MPNPPGTGLANPASYTDLGDGTVLDNVTGLVWQRDVPSVNLYWNDASKYCSSLKLSGCGWRLPTRIELVSLLDFTKPSPGPAIDTNAFPGAPNDCFWSSSAYHGSSSRWVVGFGGVCELVNHGDAPAMSHVRCVRASANSSVDASAGEYVIATGEDEDTQTGLIWQQADNGEALSGWSAAQAYCGSLRLNGHAWRVPSIKELETLVDESKDRPAIDTNAFPGTANEHYCSSSAWGNPPLAAWYVDFSTGQAGSANADYGPCWVRCVR
jgi:hypothetical protein